MPDPHVAGSITVGSETDSNAEGFRTQEWLEAVSLRAAHLSRQVISVEHFDRGNNEFFSSSWCGALPTLAPPANHASKPYPLGRGLTFFDPATIVKRDIKAGESFSTAYIRLPFWASSR